MAKPNSLYDDPEINNILSTGRTLPDVLFKMLAVHTATTIAVGHLTTLKGMPEKVQTQGLVAFWFCPMFPWAELIVDIGRSLRAAWKKETRGNFAYHFAACLGMRATPKDGDEKDALSLLDVSSDSRLLKRHTSPRDLRWAARLGVLLAFVAQDLSVLILYVRRMQMSVKHPDDVHGFMSHCDADFDTINAQFAIGGLAAGLLSFVLTACSWTWTYHPMGVVSGAISSHRQDHWSNIFPWYAKSPLWVELLLCQILTNIVTTRSTWYAAESVVYVWNWGDEDPFGKNPVPLPRVRGVSAIPWIWAFICLCFAGASVLPIAWQKRLRIPKNFLSGAASMLAMLCLATTRLMDINGALFDVLAVRGCARKSAGYCVPAFVWKAPKEGVIWAL